MEVSELVFGGKIFPKSLAGEVEHGKVLQVVGNTLSPPSANMSLT